jgi:ABC-type Fe3+/spermidine/putrescine transport system ATPase subunit
VTPPILELAAVTKRFGDFVAVDNLSLTVAPGEFLTLLGASGSGKTTTLRMIAGFEHPEAGEIRMGGTPITGLPPYQRDLNTVFQQYALFPHMTVRENVGYGLRMRHTPTVETADRVAKALDMVQLGHLAGRMPRQLSGGQQQRVALARALVNRPRVLLLDEPLGALDLKLRKEMQLELKHLNRQLGITFLYVTHDQEEALTMSDRIALMRNGRIEQLDAPQAMYQRPVSKYVADFIGETNILPGDAVGLPVGSWLAVRPEHIRPVRGDEAGPTLTVVVREAVFTGAITRLHTTLPNGQELVLHWPAEDPVPAPESALRVTWPAERGVRVSE